MISPATRVHSRRFMPSAVAGPEDTPDRARLSSASRLHQWVSHKSSAPPASVCKRSLKRRSSGEHALLQVCDSHPVEPAGNRAFAPPPLVAAAGLELESAAAARVGWGFIALYTLAFMSTSLLFLAPLLVTLALKVNSLVGIQQAPSSLALV